MPAQGRVCWACTCSQSVSQPRHSFAAPRSEMSSAFIRELRKQRCNAPRVQSAVTCSYDRDTAAAWAATAINTRTRPLAAESVTCCLDCMAGRAWLPCNLDSKLTTLVCMQAGHKRLVEAALQQLCLLQGLCKAAQGTEKTSTQAVPQGLMPLQRM